MKLRKIAATFAALGLALAFGSASAAPLTVELQFKGTPQGTVQGDVFVGGDRTNTRAGEFSFEVISADPGVPVDLTQRLLAYCAEANIRLTTGTSVIYTVHDPMDLFAAGTVDNVSRLYTGFLGASRTSAINSAAFQLALWEILKESDGTTFDLSSDFFRAAYGVNSSDDWNAAVDQATDWLARLGNFSANRQFLLLKSDTSQDLVFIPVPEPGMLLLIGSGLLFGVAIRRRIRS